jgi:hypothetical protein
VLVEGRLSLYLYLFVLDLEKQNPRDGQPISRGVER